MRFVFFFFAYLIKGSSSQADYLPSQKLVLNKLKIMLLGYLI